MDIGSHSVVGNGMMHILGLQDKQFKILYYHKSDGFPLNLKSGKALLHPYYVSGIYFLEDTCSFNKDGIASDNNIKFLGEIANKRVAACLPDDYVIAPFQ